VSDGESTYEVGAVHIGPVNTMFEDYQGLVRDLRGMSPSGLSALNRSYHKHLLVAAASDLESRVKELVPEIFLRHGRDELSAFVAKNVLSRGYSTLFSWNDETAQPFFAGFGEACGKGFKARLKTDDALKTEHDAFMRLGNLRNRVVHNNYAMYSIELTPAEVIELYHQAVQFTHRFEDLIFSQGSPQT
jgi:hypothetical protein